MRCGHFPTELYHESFEDIRPYYEKISSSVQGKVNGVSEIYRIDDRMAALYSVKEVFMWDTVSKELFIGKPVERYKSYWGLVFSVVTDGMEYSYNNKWELISSSPTGSITVNETRNEPPYVYVTRIMISNSANGEEIELKFDF